MLLVSGRQTSVSDAQVGNQEELVHRNAPRTEGFLVQAVSLIEPERELLP